MPGLFVIALLFAGVSPVFAEDDLSGGENSGSGTPSLFQIPLEELMSVKVISVTRAKGQDVFTSPAAIYVITQEDIRHSGLDSLPELFRLVPGVQLLTVFPFLSVHPFPF